MTYKVFRFVAQGGCPDYAPRTLKERRLATTCPDKGCASLRGCLYYNPRAYPFGGSGSLIELIESFGNKITYDSWQKKKNPITKSEWNFELAKKLVSRGIGFTPEILDKL